MYLFESNKTVKRIEKITSSKIFKFILALDEESKRNLILVTLGHF